MIDILYHFYMKNKQQYYTVGEVATMLNISIDTIRRWNKKGLIKSFRDNRNARMFSLEEIKRINTKIKQDIMLK